MQHTDERAPQFPPPGMAGQPLAPHEDAEGYAEYLRQKGVAAPKQDAEPALLGQGEPEPRPTLVHTGDDDLTDFEDYFGFDERHRYILPDKRQWIEFKVLNEGDLKRYNTILKRDIRIEKKTGDAHLRIDQVEERHALLAVAVTDWYLLRRDGKGNVVAVKWDPRVFQNWLEKASPAIVGDLADAVRKMNPFLLGTGDETLEAIDRQIDQLMEQRKIILERQQGEESSATR